MSKITFIDSQYRYGFHVRKYPTLTETVKRVAETTLFSNFQVCLSSPQSYDLPKFDVDDILSARKILEERDLIMFVHGCFLYNLCGAPKHREDSKFGWNVKKTVEGLTMELDISVGLGCKGVVVHPNSCHDVKKGLFTASQMMKNILTRDTHEAKKLSKKMGISLQEFKRRRKIIIENSAHEGGKRGWNLEELGQMIKAVDNLDLRKQIGVCIDTAHAYGAGIYDFGEFTFGYELSGIKKFYDDFEREIGIEYLSLFHLNDSMRGSSKKDDAYYGSKKDRHEHLGLGYIFGEVSYLDIYIKKGGKINWGNTKGMALKEFFKQAYDRQIPVIGEPPDTHEGGKFDWEQICQILKKTDRPLVYP